MSRMRRSLRLPIFIGGTACILLAGCSKITQENYNKLKVGMTYEEVTAILGKPTTCSDAMFAKSCRWGDEKRNISITFLGDKIILHVGTNLR